MTFSAASLQQILQVITPKDATGLVVAVSGGIDSACLAMALASLRDRACCDLPLRAVHT